MDESQISAQWPPLIKHTEPYHVLFPRIEFENRDEGLEGVLSQFLEVKINDTNRSDFIEGSRRLREAMLHDAYLCWAPKDRDQLEALYRTLNKAKTQIESMEGGQFKAIIHTSSNRDLNTSVFNLSLMLSEILESYVILKAGLSEDIPSATANTRTHAFSVMQRLIEVWKVIKREEPSIYQSSNLAANDGESKFQKCLQKIGDHLELSKLDKGRPFNARSLIGEYLKKDKKPLPDKVE